MHQYRTRSLGLGVPFFGNPNSCGCALGHYCRQSEAREDSVLCSKCSLVGWKKDAVQNM